MCPTLFNWKLCCTELWSNFPLMNPVQRGDNWDREQRRIAPLHFEKSAPFCRKSCFNQPVIMCSPDQWANRHNSTGFGIPALCQKEKSLESWSLVGWWKFPTFWLDEKLTNYNKRARPKKLQGIVCSFPKMKMTEAIQSFISLSYLLVI